MIQISDLPLAFQGSFQGDYLSILLLVLSNACGSTNSECREYILRRFGRLLNTVRERPRTSTSADSSWVEVCYLDVFLT